MQTLKILALCIAAAVVYGVVHDQITVRLCREYFTVAHPPVFGEDVPDTLLAMGWGVIATWWAGLLVGVPLVLVARLGDRPKLAAADLLRPIAVLLLTMAVLATLAGFAGYWLATSGRIQISPAFAVAVPPERHARFLAAGAAHLASYATGFLGGIALVFATFLRRRRRRPGGRARPRSVGGSARGG